MAILDIDLDEADKDRQDNHRTLAERLVAQANAIAPALRARAEATNQQRRLPQETIDDLRSSGALKTIQSTRNGGYGLGMREHLDVLAALGRGC